MTTPSLVVEIGFDDGPLVASPTWTAVTSYVLASPGVTISRGRNTEFDQATSSASFTLDNRSRLFDPTNTVGTYYGKLLPRRPVRIRATWNAVTYDLFRGVVEGWPQTLPNTVESTVTVRCIDLLAVLGETELEDAAFVYAQGTGHLNGALRTMVNGLWYDDVGGYVMRRRAGLVSSESSFAKGPGTAVNVANAWYSVNDFYADRGVGFESVGNTTGSVSFWIKAPVAPVPSYEEAIMGTVTNSAIVTRISLLNGKVRYVGSGTTTPIKESLYRVDDEAWHHVVVTISGSTQLVYVDGQDVTLSVASSSSTFQGINVIGRVQWTSSASNWVDAKSTIQDVWTFDDALTAAEVLELYDLGKGEKLESTAARFGRVCDAGDVPAGLRSATSVPQGEVLEIDLFGNIAQSELQTVADSEYGRMFVSRDGKITLHDRFWWKTQTRGNTVQVTFSDAPGAGEYKFSGVGFDLSDREVANKVTVTGSVGLRHTSEDATSQTAFGVERTSQSTILSRNSLVESLADGILALRKDAVLRMDAIEVRAQGDTASWPSVLDRELGDRFKIEVKPANTGTQQNVELLLERIEWSIRGGEWVGRFTGAPIPNYSLFILDSSTLNGTDKLGF